MKTPRGLAGQSRGKRKPMQSTGTKTTTEATTLIDPDAIRQSLRRIVP
jgi:hypothetical protein